jgi:hypothetical protein
VSLYSAPHPVLPLEHTVRDSRTNNAGWARTSAAVVRHFVGVLVMGASVLAARTACAQEEPIYLDYRASPDCPSRAEFEDQVRARTARARFVDQPGSVRRFLVEAYPEKGHVTGRLTSSRDEQTGEPRQVTSDDCGSVVAALALMTALAVDPRAATQAAPSERSAIPVASMPPTELPPPRPRPLAQPALHVQSRAQARPWAAPKNQSGWGSLSAGMCTRGLLWVAPTFVPMGILSASLEWQALAPTLVAPSVRWSGLYGASPTVHPTAGAAKFRLLSAMLEACPVRLAVASGATLRPCVGLEGGSLSARGIAEGRITSSDQASLKWWAVLQALRLQLDIGRGWRAEAQGGAVEPLFAYEFVFRSPAVEIVHVPWVAPTASLGVSYHFL